jgi:hypothetical protein
MVSSDPFLEFVPNEGDLDPKEVGPSLMNNIRGRRMSISLSWYFVVMVILLGSAP